MTTVLIKPSSSSTEIQGAALQTLPPLPQLRRYHSLDLWRGLACIFVVVFHTTTVFAEGGSPNGPKASIGGSLMQLTRYLHVGVPMFFVISGYCISATAESARTKRVPVSDYFRRRFRRIFPPFWAAIVLQCGLILLLDVWLEPGLLSHAVLPVGRPWLFSPWQWCGTLTLTETWRSHFVGNQSALILGQAWTLCYEEQFYAVTGLVLLLCPRQYFIACAAITVGVVACGKVVPLQWRTGFFIDGSWLTFAAGVALYYSLNYCGWIGKSVFGVALGLLACYAALRGNRDLTVASVFTGCLLALRPWDQIIANCRWFVPIAFCGQMCYSLYLVHVPIARGVSQYAQNHGISGVLPTLMLVVPVSLMISIALGRAFYLMVERHFLNTPQSRTS